MNTRTVWLVLLAAGLGVAAYAGLRSPPPEPAPPPTADAPPAKAPPGLPPNHPPVGAGATPGTPGPVPQGGAQDLPPGHPPITGMGGAAPGAAPAAPSGEEAPATWTKPARWQDAPNPSSMRIATYKVPRAAGDAEDAEMSVSRAGGGTVANAERWVGQFDEAGQKTAKRSERLVGGFKATVVEVEGTFSGGMSMGAPSGPKPGFGLLGAIVETPGTAHFFKLTGPAATVKGARAELDALLASFKAQKN